MKFHGFAIVLVLIFAVHAYGQRTDVVVMKNGDRLTCEITGLKYGTLFVKLDYVDGTVEINWARVAKVESNRLFIVKTEDGKVREGQISTAETDVSKAVRIDVKVDADTTVELETADVVKIDTSSDRFWKRFNGSVNLGLNYSKGNNATQYNLNSSVEYPRERWGIEANLDSTLSSNDGSETSTRNELRTKVYRLLPQEQPLRYGWLRHFAEHRARDIAAGSRYRRHRLFPYKLEPVEDRRDRRHSSSTDHLRPARHTGGAGKRVRRYGRDGDQVFQIQEDRPQLGRDPDAFVQRTGSRIF